MGIGKRIKQAREYLNLTQKELGERIGVTGSAITNYENEVSHPKEPIMYKLINALGVDANFLFQDSIVLKKTPPSEDRGVTEEEFELVEIYRELNEDGHRAYRAAANGFFSISEYKKCSDFENGATVNRDNDVAG